MAEAGTNHLGSPARARQYVLAAKNAGCDIVKFQLFTKSELFCPMKGDYKRFPRWCKSVMSLDDWKMVRDYAKAKDIKFCVSVFQMDGIELMNKLDVDYVKVASRAAPNFPYEKCEGPFIVSNGLKLGFIKSADVELECVMKYPAPLSDCFWDAGDDEYGPVGDGISDHSGTVWPAIDACFKGAKMVEVHFALDPLEAGPDAPVCLTPDQLKLICEARDAAASM